MYPDPPHLMITVYAEQPEIDTFAAMCAVAGQHGCEPTGLVQTGPRDQEFDFVSELGDAQKLQKVASPERVRLISGEDPALRVVAAEYSHPEFGLVTVEYLLRHHGDRHPIAVTPSAGPLGLPPEIWSEDDQRGARKLAQWSRALFESATSGCDPLYGAIAVERTLPGPSELRAGNIELYAELYVAERLLERSPEASERLRAAYLGDETEWEKGRFYASWAPYTASGTDLGDPRNTALSSAEALGTMLESWQSEAG